MEVVILKKKIISKSNIGKDPIHIAVSDFSITTKLYKKYSVFVVWKRNLENYENIITVTVSRYNGKLLLTKDNKVGSKGKLPSQYIENNGKLFFWWDDDYPLTENMLKMLKKYNLLQDDDNGKIRGLDFATDDSQKGAHYYFCKDNPLKYKKVITNVGIGYYEVPSLDCKNR